MVLALIPALALAEPEPAPVHRVLPLAPYAWEDCREVAVLWSANGGPTAVERCVRRDALPFVFDAEVRALAEIRTVPDGFAWSGGGPVGLVIDGVVASEELRDAVLLGRRPLPWLPRQMGR